MMVRKAKKTSPIPGYKKGKTIIPKLPTDARRNLAKLERGRAGRVDRRGGGPSKVPLDEDMTSKQRLKAIWKDEGIDMAVACADNLGYSKIGVLKQILKWVQKETIEDES